MAQSEDPFSGRFLVQFVFTDFFLDVDENYWWNGLQSIITSMVMRMWGKKQRCNASVPSNHSTWYSPDQECFDLGKLLGFGVFFSTTQYHYATYIVRTHLLHDEWFLLESFGQQEQKNKVDTVLSIWARCSQRRIGRKKAKSAVRCRHPSENWY